MTSKKRSRPQQAKRDADSVPAPNASRGSTQATDNRDAPPEAQAILHSFTQMRTGPIPSPETLREYYDIDDGAVVNWILEHAGKAQEHRHEIERTQVRSFAGLLRFGIAAFAAIICTAIVGGVTMAIFADDALVRIIASIVATVSALAPLATAIIHWYMSTRTKDADEEPREPKTGQ